MRSSVADAFSHQCGRLSNQPVFRHRGTPARAPLARRWTFFLNRPVHRLARTGVVVVSMPLPYGTVAGFEPQ
jgi:hypothetical protein